MVWNAAISAAARCAPKIQTVTVHCGLFATVFFIAYPALAQTSSFLDASGFSNYQPVFDLNAAAEPSEGGGDTPPAPGDSTTSSQPGEGGLIHRGVRRILHDQKELYAAPFKSSNVKWDLMLLAGTGALLATDRRIEGQLPDGRRSPYSNMSNIAIGSISGTLGLMWMYGIKTNNEHLKETGSLELETLIDTFLVYTPMQLIAGRQRPGVGNDHGDFWQHHSVNTSFPAGHPMFTMAMAAVVAHEYPKTWVKLLAYGTVATVAAGRLLAHDHWASDELVGTALGYFIGTHVFHAHCKAAFNEGCRRPATN